MAETIGRQLKQAREAKNLTIQKVVQATHIRAHQIEALEADDFESLPSLIQARAFLRLYAEFLSVSLKNASARQQEGAEEPPTNPEILPFAPNQGSSSSINSGTNPIQTKKQALSGKLTGMIARILNIFPGQKEPFVLVEIEEKEKLAEQRESAIPGEPGFQTENIDSIKRLLPSQEIFIDIGRTLQRRRESLSLTLDEVERQTHVRKHYLAALEVGEISSLPSSVQARGMLGNYAHFLNLDVDATLLTFANGLQTLLFERQATAAEQSEKYSSKVSTITRLPFRIKIPASIRRYISVDIIVGGGLVVLLLTFAIWGTSRIINMSSGSTPQPTVPPMINFLLYTLEPLTSTPEPTTTGNGTTTGNAFAVETFSGTLPAAGNGPVQVVVIAQNSAFVRVTVDGKVEFDGRVTAGTAYPYDGNLQIEVLTGNGRAISILFNQNNLGPMGDFGQVVDRIYTANSILNPTATFTPTPSITPTPTITLRPTSTPRPSATPRRNPTLRPTLTPEN